MHQNQDLELVQDKVIKSARNTLNASSMKNNKQDKDRVCKMIGYALLTKMYKNLKVSSPIESNRSDASKNYDFLFNTSPKLKKRISQSSSDFFLTKISNGDTVMKLLNKYNKH